MKSAIVIAGLVLGIAYVVIRPSDEPPTDETIVALPRAQLWAELAKPFNSMKRKAEHATTVAGTPPVRVKFTFNKLDGEMLDIRGVAAFRTVEAKAWLEDGSRSGETRLKVLFKPESLGKATGSTDLRYQLRNLLERADAQLVEGARVTALFGGQAC